jgi:hypothetical protein
MTFCCRCRNGADRVDDARIIPGRDRRQGVIKLALASYDARTGTLRQSLEPVYGFSQRTEWVVLLFFGWQDNDLVPNPDNDPWVGESTFELSSPGPKGR